MKLNNRLEIEQLKEKKGDFKKIFFFRICGTGMGACASILKEYGFQVEGGDLAFYPPMSHYLKELEIPLHDLGNVDRAFLQSYDLIVVGNAIPRNSEQARVIEECGIAFCSFPAILGALVLSEVNVVGVAGTHGKTTTTYLLSQLFTKLGEKPGHFIGGVINNTPPALLGAGRYFFIESDEYDSAYFEKISKFRSYQLNHLILTSLEFDHADIFSDIDQIKNEFTHLIPQVNCSTLISADYSAAQDIHDKFLAADNGIELKLYGESSEIGPHNIKSSENGTQFTLVIDQQREQFETNLIGKHNILNLSSAILFAYSEQFDLNNIKRSITDLKLVKRRQELRGVYHGSPVIDDFAHHPTAVTLTVEAMISHYPQYRIVTILEPGSATARSDLFQARWVAALGQSSEVIIIRPQRSTTIKDGTDLDCDKLQLDLKAKQQTCNVVSTLPEMQAIINQCCGDKKLLLFLSNGPCLGLWESDFVNELW